MHDIPFGVSPLTEEDASPDEKLLSQNARDDDTSLTDSTERFSVWSKKTFIKKILASIREELIQIERILTEDAVFPSSQERNQRISHRSFATASNTSEPGQAIEGVFDGQNMIGQDGKEYPVPPNYASKSKLVEGDLLKLTVSPTGSFIYKQIGPIERKRIIARLEYDAAKHQYTAVQENKRWKLLTASVTYYKGEAGDQVIVLVPQSGPSMWAAVENIMKQYDDADDEILNV